LTDCYVTADCTKTADHDVMTYVDVNKVLCVQFASKQNNLTLTDSRTLSCIDTIETHLNYIRFQ